MSERSKQPKQGDSDASVASPPVGGATSLYRPRELIVERGAAYAIIVCFFYMSGSALMNEHYALKVLAMTGFAFVAAVTFSWRHEPPSPRAVGFLLLVIGFLFLPAVLWSDYDLSTYVAIAMILVSSFLTAQWISLTSCRDKYVTVMIFFAAVSLVGFAISLFHPEVALLFPFHEGTASSSYYDAVIYRFTRSRWEVDTLSLAKRNAGICWEPGAYQVFLNLALFFILSRRADGRRRGSDIAAIVILVITILSTLSTTGLFVLGVLLVAYWAELWSALRLPWKPTMAIVGVLVVLLVGLRKKLGVLGGVVDALVTKLTNEVSGLGVMVAERLSLGGLRFFMEDGPLGFFGMSFFRWSFVDAPLWNSVIHALVVIGLPFTALLVAGYWFSARAISQKPWVMIVVLFSGFFTQTLFWRALFAYFVFAGIRATWGLQERGGGGETPDRASVDSVAQTLREGVGRQAAAVVSGFTSARKNALVAMVCFAVALTGGAIRVVSWPPQYTKAIELDLATLPLQGGKPTPPGYVVSQLTRLVAGTKTQEFQDLVNGRLHGEAPNLSRMVETTIDADAVDVSLRLRGDSPEVLDALAPVVGSVMDYWINLKGPRTEQGFRQFWTVAVKVTPGLVEEESPRGLLVATAAGVATALAIGFALTVPNPSRSRMRRLDEG